MRRLTPLVIGLLLVSCGDVDEPTAPEQFAVDETAADAGGQSGRYIVTVTPNAKASDVAKAHGLEPDFTYSHVLHGFAARIPDAALDGLSRNPNVERIEADIEMTTLGTQSNATWGLDRIDQRGASLDGSYSYDHTGAGVTAYIVDTGIRYTHNEFGGRAEPGYDAFGGDGVDCNGHGTHVAGTVGGATWGVAKGVRLVGVRVLNCQGSGTVSGVVAGLDWVADQGARPAVINMSLGGAVSSTLDDAVHRAIDAGVTVVVAAGNSDADACSYSPARAARALTIGATEQGDKRAYFSNWGPCLDLFAPGRTIYSAYILTDDSWTGMSGTSMAAPHVTGAAALILDESPGLSPAAVASAIAERSTKDVVAGANSANDHLLYTRGAASAPDPGEPQPENAAPAAAFQAQCADLGCSFTDQSSDSDGSVVSWSWAFGDGASSSLRHPERTYAAAGTYTVTLSVTDDDGATALATREVTVAEPVNEAPSAGFAASCVALACDFSDLSNDSDGTITRWDWDFGDGSTMVQGTATSSHVSHAYDEAGSYDVRLTVTDDVGATDTHTATVVVEAPAAEMTLSLTPFKEKGRHRVELAWTGATTSSVEVYLQGVLHATVDNTGSWVFGNDERGKGSYSFQVCETGDGLCSPVAVAEF